MGLLADLTDTWSAVGRRHPELMQDRSVRILIDLTIEEAKKREARSVPVQAPSAPVDFDEH